MFSIVKNNLNTKGLIVFDIIENNKNYKFNHSVCDLIDEVGTISYYNIGWISIWKKKKMFKDIEFQLPN